MARSPSIVADSEGNAGDAPDDASMKDVANGEESGEEEEEYEIEQILKHNRGQFPDGRIGYFVKWKNYGPEHNSWVDEEDAGNAQELIDNYWNKKNTRKSETASARKGRKSAAATDSPEPSKKRRKSVKEDDEEQASVSVSTKKKRTTKKKSESVEPELAQKDAEEEDDELVATESYMQQFMKQISWEKMIARVDTVEKPGDNEDLVVYFRLKKDNKRVRLPARTCNEKFPQSMIKFYEANLKWKETEMVVDWNLFVKISCT